MLDDGSITAEEHERPGIAEPLTRCARQRRLRRGRLLHRGGPPPARPRSRRGRLLYQGGLSVRTTLDPDLQAAPTGRCATASSPMTGPPGLARRRSADAGRAWPQPTARQPALAASIRASSSISWPLAVVLDAAGEALGSASPTASNAQPAARRDALGPPELGARANSAQRANAVTDVLSPGDARSSSSRLAGRRGRPRWASASGPAVEGALVALDPHTGRVLAMTGGFSFAQSAVQPGHPGAPPARLGVQAVRLSGGARARLHTVQHHPRCADRDRPGTGPAATGSRRTTADTFYGPSTLRARHREVAQPDDRAPRPGDRHGSDRRHAPSASASTAASALNLASALGSNEVDLLEPDQRLRHAGQRRQARSSRPLVERIQDRHRPDRQPARRAALPGLPRRSPGTAQPPPECWSTSASR